MIGQGFQPFNAERITNQPTNYFISGYIGKLPYLPIRAFRPFAQPLENLLPWPSNHVRRKGFERGFAGPRILIPQGVDTIQQRLRATYLEAPVTFQDVLQAIVVPPGEEHIAKLLTALLNSRLIAWFAFHGTGSFGSDRPKVHQSELMHFPFPSPDDTPERERSKSAENSLVSLINQMIESGSDPFRTPLGESDIFGEVDRLTYQFFCLSDDEITLVDDTVKNIIPAVQPRQSLFPDMWRPADRRQRQEYATTLIRSMSEWFDSDCTVGIKLEARNEDLAVLRLALEVKSKNARYIEEVAFTL